MNHVRERLVAEATARVIAAARALEAAGLDALRQANEDGGGWWQPRDEALVALEKALLDLVCAENDP